MSAKDYAWLREGLVGLRHRDLYLHNAEFHAQIDALNQMLPLMVDGLALQAEKVGDRQDAEKVARMSASTSRPGWSHLPEAWLRMNGLIK